jgi:hypothetical protein
MGSIFFKFFITQFLIFVVPRVQRWCASSSSHERCTQLPREAIVEFDAGAAQQPRPHRRCRHDVANSDDGSSLFEAVGLVLQLVALLTAQLYFIHFIGILQVIMGVPFNLLYEIITANSGRDALRRHIYHMKSVCILGLVTSIIYVLVQTHVVQLDEIEQVMIDSIYKTVLDFFDSFSQTNSKYFE